MDLATIILLGGFSLFVGLLIGSVGIGGVLLLPILTYVFDLEVHIAIAAAMFGYIFSGLVGVIVYSREGSIKWPMAFWLIIGAMPAAFFGAMTASAIPSVGLEVLIAIFVVLSGLRALISKNTDNGKSRFTKPTALICVGFITGFGSALTGTGGPLLLVPIMVSLKLATHTAVGLSQAIQLPVAGFATIGNFFYGHIDLLISGTIALGLIIGGTTGAKLAHIISSVTMSKIVAWLLMLVGFFIIGKLFFI